MGAGKDQTSCASHVARARGLSGVCSGCLALVEHCVGGEGVSAREMAASGAQAPEGCASRRVFCCQMPPSPGVEDLLPASGWEAGLHLLSHLLEAKKGRKLVLGQQPWGPCSSHTGLGI